MRVSHQSRSTTNQPGLDTCAHYHSGALSDSP
jgi:hypothetical protein